MRFIAVFLVVLTGYGSMLAGFAAMAYGALWISTPKETSVMSIGLPRIRLGIERPPIAGEGGDPRPITEFVNRMTGRGSARMLAACEAAIVRRLQSPSTYVRVHHLERVTAMSLDEALADAAFDIEPGKSATETYRRYNAFERKYRFELIVAFDSKNDRGTPVRQRGRCAFPAWDEWPEPHPMLLIAQID